jgi:hypothetical protein
MAKKVLILLPDGVGLKNFAFTDFYKIGIQNGFEIKYWNNTPFNLSELGFNEIKIQKAKLNTKTDIYKNARKHVELNQFVVRFNDIVYDSYRFPFSNNSLKKFLKSSITKAIIYLNNSDTGLKKIREKIKTLEQSTTYFNQCLEVLKKEQPDLVFCTNQRSVSAVAPLLAAQSLNIPTATFIFSWDNLPKATMVVETDYYFVWSDYMKKELLNYYSYISESQVFICGTPQFENHFNDSFKMSREDFFAQNGLDVDKRYICYSGDDITTCPDDAKYLEDLAEFISLKNQKGENYGILFRPSPADFSNRYDDVIKKYADIIVVLKPLWKQINNSWDTILPTPEDFKLQYNTILHTDFVVNLGSSMVFDYAAHNKFCGFINYDIENKKNKKWSVDIIYKYVHFRSMPNQNAVIWINDKHDFQKLFDVKDKSQNINSAKEWFDLIIGKKPTEASRKIWESIITIIK